MKKFIITSASLIALMTTGLSPAYAVSLKQNSIITNGTITLGDIFYDLPRDADRVLGSAPQPGQEMMLDARTLLRIALALDLPWRPANAGEHIVLRSEATIISYDMLKSEIIKELEASDVYGNYEISIPEQFNQIILPADQPATLEITRFDIDAKRENFQAVIAAPSAQNPIRHFSVNGKLHSVMSVPVLSANLQNGHIIGENDIEYIQIKESDYTKDTIADTDELIGLTARRLVVAGKPIKQSDLIAPQIVERGALVILSLNDNILNITTQVKALENGAKGQIIRVVNTDSNQMIQARVTGPNAVAIVN